MSFVKKALVGYGVLNSLTLIVVFRLLGKHGISVKDYYRIVFKGPRDNDEAKKIYSLDWDLTFKEVKSWKEKVELDIISFYVGQLQSACERHGYFVGTKLAV